MDSGKQRAPKSASRSPKAMAKGHFSPSANDIKRKKRPDNSSSGRMTRSDSQDHLNKKISTRSDGQDHLNKKISSARSRTWDASDGQALMDKVASRTRAASNSRESYSWSSSQGRSLVDEVSARALSSAASEKVSSNSKDFPYLGLVHLFNQFQGMPCVDSNSSKVLVTVTVLGSTGPLRMLVAAEATVKDIINAALCKYAREGRVPSLGSNSDYFELHCSQFSHEALGPDEVLTTLGTRNFVLCPRNRATLLSSCGSRSAPKTSSHTRPWWSIFTGIKSVS